MPTISETVQVEASAEAVWKVLADVSVLPQLSSSTKSVEVDGLLDRVGQTFEQTVRFGGKDWTSEWRVEDVEPGRRLHIIGSLPGGTPYALVEEIESMENSTGLTITGDYELPFGMLGRLVDRLGAEKRARTELSEILHGVARMAEAGESSSGDDDL